MLNKRCAHDTCGNLPSFNYKNIKPGICIYCKLHALEDRKNIL